MDQRFRELEHRFLAEPSDRSLFELNTYRVRQGTVELPLSFEEIRETEEGGRGMLPILEMALLNYYTAVVGKPPSTYDPPPVNEEEKLQHDQRNAVYHLITAVGRLGDITYSEMLEVIADFMDLHYEGGYSCTSAEKARKVAEWFRIKDQYGFTDTTSIWDVVEASPQIDNIIVGSGNNSLSHIWSELGSSSWRQNRTPLTGSLYREGGSGDWRKWRYSIPGYSNAESSITMALFAVLNKIFNLKYRGGGGRDVLPRESWPEEVVLVVTEEAVNSLQDMLHFRYVGGTRYLTEPWKWNFLFNFEDLR